MVRHSRPMRAADRQSGPLSAAARGVLAMIAVSAVIGLAACGGAVPGAAGHPASAGAGHSKEPAAAVRASAGVPLCAAARKVDRVVASVPASYLREILPRGITIRDAPRVRALAAALCALPPMPPGSHCRAAFGAAVRLVFAAGGRGFHPVRIRLSGCRSVTGAGPARWWARSPQFGRLLSGTVGGKSPLVPGKQPSSVPTP